MAVQLVRKVRTSQPTRSVRIDWSNPITRGLVAGFNAANPAAEIVSGKLFSGSGTGLSYIGTKNGKAVTANNTGTGKFQVQTPPEGNKVTFVVVGALRNTANLGRFISFYNGAGNGRFDFFENTGVQPEFQVFFSSQAGRWWPSGSLWTNNTDHVFGITYDGSSVSNDPVFYVDGAVSAYAEQAPPSGTLVAAGTVVGFAGRPDVTTRQLEGRMALALVWDRVLSENEVREISENPWQIFEPETIPLFFSTVTAQFARPISDVSAGTWTASSGSDLYAMLDEAAASDADYIVTTGTSTCEVALAGLNDPAVSTGHIVRYRISSTTGGITVRLRQGTTTIASWTHNPAPTSLTTYSQTLSAGEADSITNYGALKLQFEAV